LRNEYRIYLYRLPRHLVPRNDEVGCGVRLPRFGVPKLAMTNNMLIDTHCHLTDERFTDIGKVLGEAKKAGVGKVIIPSTSIADAKKAVEIAEKYEQYCLVGIHPEEVETLYGLGGDQQGDSSQDYLHSKSGIASVRGTETRNDGGVLDKAMEEMEKIIRGSKKVVGVGEIGLDFFTGHDKNNPFRPEYTNQEKDRQKQLFRRQITLAIENNIPVAIHMRKAEEEMREELEMFMEKYQNGDGSTPSGTSGRVKPGMTSVVSGPPRSTPPIGGFAMKAERKFKLRGQFHCFAGSKEFLEMILANGFYISFCGNITYKSARNLRELLKKVPLERLLLETDSPYLPPEPLRGTVNTPANVKIIAEFVASELNLSTRKLAEITSQNTKCLYSLEN